MRRVWGIFFAMMSYAASAPRGLGAEDKPEASTYFSNDPYVSPLLRSPAQYYQVERGLGSVGVGKSFVSIVTERLGSDYRDNRQRQGVEATFAHALFPHQVIPGIHFSRTDETSIATISTSSTTLDIRSKSSEIVYDPFLTIDLAERFAVSGQYTMTKFYETQQDRDTHSLFYGKFIPSFVYHQRGFEAGITWEPTIQVREDDMTRADTGSTLAFAQFALAPHFAIGGSGRFIRNTEIDKENYKNTWEFTSGAEVGCPAYFLRFGGSLGYRTEAAAKDQDANGTTAPRWGTDAFATYDASALGRVSLVYHNLYARKKTSDGMHKLLGNTAELVGTLRF